MGPLRKAFTAALATFAVLMSLFFLTAPAASQPPKPRPEHMHVINTQAKIDLDTAKIARIEGDIDAGTYLTFAGDMLATVGMDGDRIVLINSRGGSVAVGKMILNLLEMERAFGAKDICIVEGQASSMALNILTKCDIRLAVPKAQFMFHAVAVGAVNCVANRCTAEYLREEAKDLDLADEPFRQANAKAFGLTLKEYDMYRDQEHTWLVPALLKRGYLQGVELNPAK